MSLFESDRKKALDNFVRQTKKSLGILISKEKSPTIKRLYENMSNELIKSKWQIIKGKRFIESSAVQTNEGMKFSATLGLTTKIYSKGQRLSAHMTFPEKEIFNPNNSINEHGAMTIWHELGHLATKDPLALQELMNSFNANVEQVHEFISDRVAVEIALLNTKSISPSVIQSFISSRIGMYPFSFTDAMQSRLEKFKQVRAVRAFNPRFKPLLKEEARINPRLLAKRRLMLIDRINQNRQARLLMAKARRPILGNVFFGRKLSKPSLLSRVFGLRR